MSETPHTRRKFLEFLGLTAGATLAGNDVMAGFTANAQIRKLTPEQQEFMIRYGAWMDDFTEVVRLQKAEPDNKLNQKKMLALAEKAETFQPQLSEFMKDETFSMIFKVSIERMRNEIV